MDQAEQVATIKRMDDQQEQVLQDLEALNIQIESIISLYTQNRKSEDSDGQSSQEEKTAAA